MIDKRFSLRHRSALDNAASHIRLGFLGKPDETLATYSQYAVVQR